MHNKPIPILFITTEIPKEEVMLRIREMAASKGVEVVIAIDPLPAPVQKELENFDLLAYPTTPAYNSRKHPYREPKSKRWKFPD